jgi:hypothetical protein
MSENISDPFGTVQISKDLFAAQKKFLPAGQFFEHMSEAARIMSAAQMEYGKAMMRANALVFGDFLKPLAVSANDTRPSVAAKAPDPA